MAIVKTIKIKISVGENVEKLEPLYISGGDVKWGSNYGRWYEGPPDFKDKITIWSSTSTSGYSEELKAKYSNKYLYTHVHSNIFHNIHKVETT